MFIILKEIFVEIKFNLIENWLTLKQCISFIFSFDPYPGGLMDTSNNYIDRVITITGSTENCAKAEEKISEKMRQCFEQDVGSFQVSIMYWLF